MRENHAMQSSNCASCGISFVITPDDLAFYDKVSPIFAGKKELIPPPTLCPHCRSIRRTAWRNERTFYSRRCDRCNDSIITSFAPDLPFPVYCHSCWWGDGWDPKSFGQPIDLSKSFFEQFCAMTDRVPHLSLQNDNGISSENCEYTYDFAFGKNCYLTVGSWYVEDCYYCSGSCCRNKKIVDCYFLFDCELCYECMASQRLYNCRYLQNAENCSDCMFGYDLKGCKHCFGCFGLRQKEYCWENEQLSKQEYEQRLQQINMGSFETMQHMASAFEQTILRYPRRNMQLQNCEHCTGDFLFNSQEVTDSYFISDAQHCRFLEKGEFHVWCYDILHSGKPQFCYEDLTPDNSYMTHFSMWCWNTKENLYCDNCHHADNLFGCMALKHAKYCILNTQYTKEEYDALVPKIIERMRADGEWGELLPVTRSPYGYNETMAYDYEALPKQEVLRRGWRWRDPPEKEVQGIPVSALPDTIGEVPDTILSQTILCAVSNRPFKIIRQELNFYHMYNIPLPRLHPDERHRARLRKHNPQQLWERPCMKCGTIMQTTFSPDRPEIVYCEECYLRDMY